MLEPSTPSTHREPWSKRAIMSFRTTPSSVSSPAKATGHDVHTFVDIAIYVSCATAGGHLGVRYSFAIILLSQAHGEKYIKGVSFLPSATLKRRVLDSKRSRGGNGG